MARNIESKLIMKSEIDDRGIKRMREEVKGLTEDIARLVSQEMPFIGPTGTKGRKPPNVSQPSSQHLREVQKRTALTVGAAGAAAGGVGTAAGMMRAGMGGGGMEAVGGIMERAGAGVMGAFGGFGALVGLPLLAAGATFGISKALAGPGIEYNKATYGIRSRLGSKFVRNMMDIGVNAGIGPMEMAQYMPQLERVGAQQGYGALGGLRRAGITPDIALPFLTGITRAGGAGGRTPQEYESLKRATLSLVKDTHSQTEILDQVLTAIESMESTIGDVGKGGTREAMTLAKWMSESPSAALRGRAGGAVLGGMMSAIATPGSAGKEILLWSILSKDLGLREKFKANNPQLARYMPETGPLGAFQMGMLREETSSIRPVIDWAMKRGKITPHLLRAFGVKNWKTAGSMMAQYEKTGGIPEDLIKEAEAESRKKAPEEALTDIAKYTAELEKLKVMAVDLDKIQKILKAEEIVTKRFAEILKGDAFDAAISSLPKMADALVALSKGEFGDFLTKMSEAVRDGVRMAFGQKTGTQEAQYRLNAEAANRLYGAYDVSMKGYSSETSIEEYLTRVHGWQFGASDRIKDAVKDLPR